MLADKLAELKYRLAETFVQREAEVSAVLAGLVSGEPVILVGEVGSGKTAMIEALAKMVGGRYFYYLMTRFTEPEEILGSLDIRALREGRYVRRTEGRLPDAEIVFLDEIFKASSAIRNILLDIILNRRIFDDGKYIKLPMLALYTASNEISTDSDDSPFYDRLTIRSFLKPVGEEEIPNLIRCGVKLERTNIEPVMSVEEIKRLQEECRRRFYSSADDWGLLKYLQMALVELRRVGIVLSDRRKVKVLKVASALSIIEGESRVTMRSLASALKLTAVNEREDVHRVEDVLVELGEVRFENDPIIQSYVRELKTMETELKNSMNDPKMLLTTYRKVMSRLNRIPDFPQLTPLIDRIRDLLKEAEERC